ncbi:DNA recombination protein RmuC [Candidatus Mycoplasma mahonii]|uniref:DNA recombination protein RmuC n=1 Tax=Candidatus Mycoplasma mahonii TaxID=3004105 RepID=UPI0026EB4B0B|nr:DNA recombination protein RmuC [Candidatus Mycoplasma mahonii]WKX02603.1 DNA recombination protein RmuC [Candidatus Mycoplasma mahonii]
MKKINWFSRLFMSWKSLQEHMNNSEINEELITLRIEKKSFEERLLEKDKVYEQAILTMQQQRVEIAKISREILKNNASKESINDKNMEQEKELALKNQEINNLKDTILENKNNLANLKKDINEKLDPLKRIQKTFFAESGNKGKGELGEMQVKTILEKSGLEDDFWTENLIVNDKHQVEFAIKSGHEQKWVPVDSKVLDTEVDVDGKVVINSTFKSRVLTQVKEVKKYLGKPKTADYGLLVLQNDEIYMSLFNEYPLFFQTMIREHKIYICGPSSFVQFAWSISQILDIYERVHNDEKIYNQMLDTLTSITKLSASLLKVHKDFNIAMNTHYPTLQKRQKKLQNKLVKDEKIKELQKIELIE